jgi:hypothetical protein
MPVKVLWQNIAAAEVSGEFSRINMRLKIIFIGLILILLAGCKYDLPGKRIDDPKPNPIYVDTQRGIE